MNRDDFGSQQEYLAIKATAKSFGSGKLDFYLVKTDENGNYDRKGDDWGFCSKSCLQIKKTHVADRKKSSQRATVFSSRNDAWRGKIRCKLLSSKGPG